MFNNVILIGRLTEKPTVKTYEDGLKVCNITLAVLRPFKNSSGEFDTDFIPVSLWYANAQNAQEYCEKGEMVCIKGRLSQKIQQINNVNYHSIEVIGEKIIFLGNKQRNDNATIEDEKKEDVEE